MQTPSPLHRHDSRRAGQWQMTVFFGSFRRSLVETMHFRKPFHARDSSKGDLTSMRRSTVPNQHAEGASKRAGQGHIRARLRKRHRWSAMVWRIQPPERPQQTLTETLPVPSDRSCATALMYIHRDVHRDLSMGLHPPCRADALSGHVDILGFRECARAPPSTEVSAHGRRTPPVAGAAGDHRRLS